MSTDKLTNRDFSFMAVINRMKEVLDTQRQRDIAESLHMSTGDFGNRKKRGAIPYDKIVVWANSRNVNIDWLLTGQGNMRRNEASEVVSNRKSEMVLELFNALGEEDQREILHAAQEKKRLRDLMQELETLVAAQKNTG